MAMSSVIAIDRLKKMLTHPLFFATQRNHKVKVMKYNGLYFNLAWASF